MRYFLVLLLLTAPCLSLPASSGEVVDRVVAFINETAIALSELEAEYGNARKISPTITKEAVLEMMINRRLLLEEAGKLRLRAGNDDELMGEYINFRIKTFIKISEDEIRGFYDLNRANFEEAGYNGAKEEIEKYLREKEVNRRLKNHIEELRARAYIRVFLE